MPGHMVPGRQRFIKVNKYIRDKAIYISEVGAGGKHNSRIKVSALLHLKGENFPWISAIIARFQNNQRFFRGAKCGNFQN